MVNGVDDAQMPVDAVQRLYDAAREPKSLVWLRTGHLMPTDSLLIRTLIDTAFARLPVLRDTTSVVRCPRSSRVAGRCAVMPRRYAVASGGVCRAIAAAMTGSPQCAAMTRAASSRSATAPLHPGLSLRSGSPTHTRTPPG